MDEQQPRELTILIADDDDGHVALVEHNLYEAGVRNRIRRFKDGKETLDFFFDPDYADGYQEDGTYLLLLDIRMPRIDGVGVLEKLKSSARFKKLPIIMLTTTDDPVEIDTCYRLGCNVYVTKPVNYEIFSETLRRLGLFVLIVRVSPAGVEH